MLRPRLRLGLDWYEDPSFSTTGELAGAIPLVETVEADRLLGWIETGLTVFAQDDVVLDLEYRGRVGANIVAHSGAVRLNLIF